MSGRAHMNRSSGLCVEVARRAHIDDLPVKPHTPGHAVTSRRTVPLQAKLLTPRRHQLLVQRQRLLRNRAPAELCFDALAAGLAKLLRL